MMRRLTTRSSSVFAAAILLNVNQKFSVANASASHPSVPPVAVTATSPTQYDYIVIGGGSGGIASAKRAASYGAKVAVIEGERYGGTCVNVGCVPKKIMYNTGHVAEVIKEAHEFGFTIKETSFDWNAIKLYRDKYIKRLNAIYESGLDNSKVTRFQGVGSFINSHTIQIGDQQITGKHILIATGGKPKNLGVPGEEHVIDSNGFFALETQPKKVAVIGAGYIAVELAGVFNALGTQTSLFVRGGHALRPFDTMISSHLDTCMKKSGIEVVSLAEMKEVKKDFATGALSIVLKDGRSFDGYDCVLSAVGRIPLTEPLSLTAVGVAIDSHTGYIQADDYQNTSTPNIYALGDVCGKVELTPMAIAAGRRLADRLFGNMPNAKADYSFVPTVVFSHPVVGTIGYTEAEAIKLYGKENLKIYSSNFINLWYGSYYQGGVGEKPMTKYKLICVGKEEKVIGLHCIGMASDEILQGFGVAIKMGATKADFDNCIAIHPTAAEEFVTLPPWGMAPARSDTAAVPPVPCADKTKD